MLSLICLSSGLLQHIWLVAQQGSLALSLLQRLCLCVVLGGVKIACALVGEVHLVELGLCCLLLAEDHFAGTILR